MKKTFPVNINGKIFYIDEDAYRLLLDYLSQLRATFTGDEGAEIVNDIEQRISEHFDERISLGANVIVIDDVKNEMKSWGALKRYPMKQKIPMPGATLPTVATPHPNPPTTTHPAPAARHAPRRLQSTNASTATYAIKCSAVS